jgi:carbonic anhydrase/acetyltransferase-like protein (isoleucine patch superfamily)
MGDRHTMHALEHTEIELGDDGAYGFHSLVHAGPAFDPTRTGDNFTLGDLSVFFNSSAGNEVTVGAKSLVQQANLDSGDSVPPCTVQIGTSRTPVEWCDVPFPLSPSGQHPDDLTAGTGGGR